MSHSRSAADSLVRWITADYLVNDEEDDEITEAFENSKIFPDEE